MSKEITVAKRGDLHLRLETNTEVLRYTTTSLIKKRISNGVIYESDDKVQVRRQDRTRDNKNEEDNESGDARWRRSGNKTK